MSRSAFSVAVQTTTIAAGLAANAEIFQCRWTDATRKMVLKSVSVYGGGIVAFTAGYGQFDMTVARAWTANGAGGAAVNFPAGDTNKKRTPFRGTLIADAAAMRIASTAALSAGTKVLDSNRVAMQGFGVTATAGTNLGLPTPLWSQWHEKNYPLVFEKNEGFVIRATVPATGTWTACVTVEWDESEAIDVEGWS